MEQIKIAKGQFELLQDLNNLSMKVAKGEFGDFTKEEDFSKAKLDENLLMIVEAIKKGAYDNEEVIVVEQKGLVNIWEVPDMKA